MAETTLVLAELGAGTVVRLEARGHVWNADEPVEARGTDQAPNPYELLLGSLGACTTLTRCPVHRTLRGGPKMFETVEFEE